MILLAAGDSFVWGSELTDSPHGGPAGYSNSTFTAILAEQNHMPYQCVAYPGADNKDILQQILSATTDHMVIACWTWPSRSSDKHSDVEITQAQQYLEGNTIPYLFMCADNCVITTNSDILLGQWFMFPPGTGVSQTSDPRGFYQWARENKYLCGADGHPLEQAHQDAAGLIQGKFYEMVKKYLE